MIVLAAWRDAPAGPPNYGAVSPDTQADYKPMNLGLTPQTKSGSVNFATDNAAKVGIGGSPIGTAKLSVGGESSGDAVAIYTNTGNSALYLQQDDASGYAIYASGGMNYFSGNVGIGTTSPFSGAELDVYGDIALAADNWALRGNNANADLVIEELSGSVFADANARVTFQANGNVGIGTESPGYKLDVAGDANATRLCIAGSCRDSWSAVIGGATLDSVTTSGNTTSNNITVGNLTASMFYDRQNSAYYLDPTGAASGNLAGSLTVGGTVTAGTFAGSSRFTITPGSKQYGSLRINGSGTGYSGIYFADDDRTFMVDSQYQGIYQEGVGWQWYWNNGVLEAGTVPWARITGKPVGFSDDVDNVDDPNVYAFAKSALPTCVGTEKLTGNGTSLSCATDQTGSGGVTAPGAAGYNSVLPKWENSSTNTLGYSDIYSNSGKVGIGMSNPGSYTLNVAGDIYTSGSGTAANGWFVSSDARLKKNVETLSGALDKIGRARGVSYELVSGPSARQIGVVAQELEREFPELVVTDGNGYKAVAYDRLSAVLIEAVKELKSQNQALQSRLDLLEKKW